MPIAVIRVRIGDGNGAVARRSGVGVEGIADEIIPRHDAFSRAEGASQVRMVIIDSRVYHGHSYSRARVAQLALGDVGSGHSQRRVKLDGLFRRRLLGNRNRRYRIDGLHSGDAAEFGQIAFSNLDREAVPEIVKRVALRVLQLRGLGLGPERGLFLVESGLASAICQRRAHKLYEPERRRLVRHLAVFCRGRGRQRFNRFHFLPCLHSQSQGQKRQHEDLDCCFYAHFSLLSIAYRLMISPTSRFTLFPSSSTTSFPLPDPIRKSGEPGPIQDWNGKRRI